ncbi:lambda family phage portal protein [Novosphingobium chloroacetimidivorans]|uniref:Lambda family phage portal protein n=1 Tax=Novosphingobium chloroacetimidivorans TaxID=1428314 RepID=A0A7W7NWS1_9SPHN|nr:phage portal protein [Novosphingobium chloroacetimidivorans]MBB4859641.1 lambda family phage portal protein [Novosphingobium chloroacetimidivorans]
MGVIASLKKHAFSLFGGNTRRDAARSDISELQGWNPGNRHAGAGRDYGLDLILNRSRDLDENNGWINAGLDRRVESVIGVSIRLSAQPKYELLNRDYAWRMDWTGKTQARFDVWSNDIEHRNDARQMLTFGAQARLAYLSYVRDGEACAEIRDDARGLANTTNVLLIEPERVVTPPLQKGQEGPNLRDGIAYNDNGAMTGAWVVSRHPGDYSATAKERYTFIPARSSTGRAKFIHVFNPRRAEQNRGISRLAEIMVPAKMIDRVDRAEVNAALKSALLSIFIKSAGSTDDISDMLAPANDEALDPWLDAYVDFRTKNPVRVDGADVFQLFPGEDVVTPAATHPNSNYPQFIRFVLQKIAGSLGISYPQLSQDWSGINYSSARALLNELWRSFMEDRRFFTQAFLTPIYAAWLEVEVANGDVKVPGGPANFYRNKTAICMAEWIGPGRGSVDPLKEANADNLDTAAGRKSTVEAILERGRDPEDVLSEEQYYRQRRAARGLPEVNHNLKAAADESDAQAAQETADDNANTPPASTREQVPA